MANIVRILANVTWYREHMGEIKPEEFCRYFSDELNQTKWSMREPIIYDKADGEFIDGAKEPEKLIAAIKDWDKNLLKQAREWINKANGIAEKNGYSNALDMLKENTEKSCYSIDHTKAQHYIKNAMDIYLAEPNGTATALVIEADIRYRYNILLSFGGVRPLDLSMGIQAAFF